VAAADGDLVREPELVPPGLLLLDELELLNDFWAADAVAAADADFSREPELVPPGFLSGLLDDFDVAIYLLLRCRAVLRAIFSGWRTCCLPFFVPSRLARVVAAYSAGDNALIAFSGK
jgi:hypothetical protein